jgi:hypothetical protein
LAEHGLGASGHGGVLGVGGSLEEASRSFVMALSVLGQPADPCGCVGVHRVVSNHDGGSAACGSIEFFFIQLLDSLQRGGWSFGLAAQAAENGSKHGGKYKWVVHHW